MRRRDESGFGMIWAMLLVLLTGALASVLVTREQTVRRDVETDARTLRAFYAAEGGLAHARLALARDPAYTGGAHDIGVCRVEVEVERGAAREGDADRWSVTVRAAPGGVTLHAVLEAGDGLPHLRRFTR